MANGTPQPPAELSDEELDKMPLEDLQALHTRLGGSFGPKPAPAPAAGRSAFDYSNVPTQAKAGGKEGAAGLLGAPAFLANMFAAGGTGAMGSLDFDKSTVDPAKFRERVRERTAPYSTETILQGKSSIPFTSGLGLTPEQQQPPQNFLEHLARSGTANAVGVAPLALTNPEMIPALLGRTAAATLAGESGAKLMESLGSPEAAPWARAAGNFLGFGPVRGFQTAPERAAATTRLTEAGFPVSVAERSGSRWAGTLEQSAPKGREAIGQLAGTNMNVSPNTSNIQRDLQTIANRGHRGMTPQQQGNVTANIDYFNRLSAGGHLSAEDYLTFSKNLEKLGKSNPTLAKMADRLDKEMMDQNPIWRGKPATGISRLWSKGEPSMRERLAGTDIAGLERAQRELGFPAPFEVSEGVGATLGPVGYGAAHLMGHPGAAEPAMLFSLLGLTKASRTAMAPISPLARSAPGQAWMGGWPTNQTATYATLLAGPGKRLSSDIWDPSQQPQQVK